MKFFKSYYYLGIALIGVFQIVCVSCDSVAVDSPDFQMTTPSVFNDDASAESAMIGIYSRMMRSSGFASGGIQSVTFLAGLSSDELTNYSFDMNQGEFASNAILATNSWNESSLWKEAYQYIYSSNAILEGVGSSDGVSLEKSRQIQGEALFIRAFCYFYLVNLYGDLPLATTTDYKVNSILIRSDTSIIYDQIIRDLILAFEWLPSEYLVVGERTRPIKWTASALLSRVYRHLGNWEKAEGHATTVIDENYYLAENMDKVFLRDSPEAIWQLQPVVSGLNTREGSMFILAQRPNLVTLSSNLVEAFEDGDLRRTSWIGNYTDGTNEFYYSYKYKVRSGTVISEYSMVMRLAEQYLIRAEARAQLGNLSGAKMDLNMIRNRSGLSNTIANSQEEIIIAIENERRVELFTEWGHRWLDLKLMGKADAVLGPLKPEWSISSLLYPIPQSELKINPNIVQNPGY